MYWRKYDQGYYFILCDYTGGLYEHICSEMVRERSELLNILTRG